MSMFEKRNTGTQTEGRTKPPQSQGAASDAPRPTPQAVRAAALIGPAIKISGEISGKEGLTIEGAVEGTINLPNHAVSVGKSGVVNANISAAIVSIQGRVKGDIVGSKKVILSAHARVQGNITAPRVNLEDGAKFKGSIDMHPVEDPAAQPAPGKPTSAAPATVNRPAAPSKPETNPAPKAATGKPR